MRFGRNITLLLLITLTLAGLLIASRYLHPERRVLAGDAIFPMSPETITTIAWDIMDEKGEAQTIRIERRGNFWEMGAPYAGLLCDHVEISKLLDTIQGMKVIRLLDSELQHTLDPSRELIANARNLVVSTPERSRTCTFGDKPVMELAQMLAMYNDALIAVKTADVAALPESASKLWSRSILPVSAANITSLEWRATGKPFVSAHRKADGVWTVTQPFAFDPNPTDVSQALKLLTGPQTIATYIRPVPGEETLTTLSETLLATYGLDEEYAIRVVIRLRGMSEPLQLRFGKKDPNRPNHLYCLLNDRRSVVSVSEKICQMFTEAGPFIASHEDLPLLGDVTPPASIEIIGKSKDQTTVLMRTQARWEISTPAVLPADTPLAESLLRSLLALTGDLTESRPLNEAERLCTVEFRRSGEADGVQLAFYKNTEAGTLLASRHDAGRLYVLNEADVPEILRNGTDLNRALLDRTILAIPTENIRRISVDHDGHPFETVACLPGSKEWHTEYPRGVYPNTVAIQTWLEAFTLLKATTILQSSIPYGELQKYGLDAPAMKITLDLNENTTSLRRILLIGEPIGNYVPAMIQGRPLVYALDFNTLRVFNQALTTVESNP